METHVSLSDLKKAFDQTLRTLKREVNKRVLKAPDIEQKVLEATCNEPWGPHGSIMADIAKASRDYHEYQIIMPIIWKRLRDTGQNWRHVYKTLMLLEYLVINGSEKVVTELIEHMLELQALTDFQFMEPPPYEKDQGINVQKKAQTVVALLKDSEGLRELRKKSMNNKNKYEGISSAQFSTKSESDKGIKEKEIERRGSSPPGYDDIFSSQYDETTGQNVTRDGPDFTSLARNYSQGPSAMRNSSINKNNTDGKLNPREIQSTSAGKDWFSAAFEQPLRQDNLITNGKPLSGPQIHSTEMWNAHSRGIEIRRISFDNPLDQHQMAASFLPSPVASSKIIPYTQPWPQENILRSRQEPEMKTLMPSLIPRESFSISLIAPQITERNSSAAFENGRTISREDRIMRLDRKANEKPKPFGSQTPENLQDTWGDWCGS